MRRTDREIRETDRILEIIGKAKILHLGLIDDGDPYVVPMHFGYEYRDETLVFYMHCAKEGRKLELVRENPRACVELECGVELVSGGDNPCRYGSAYASVIARGKARIVEDGREKIRALELLMLNQTGRTFEIDGRMASSVEVIRVTAKEFTAKSRPGPIEP